MVNVEREIEQLMYWLIPYGWADMSKAVETAGECGYDGQWVGKQVESFVEDTGVKLEDVDVCYVVYDALLQEARNDIEDLTETDILNDVSEEVSVYGNYMCTSLDYSEEAKEEILNILAEVDKEDFTDAIKWLVGELGISDEELEEAKNALEEEEEEEEGEE